MFKQIFPLKTTKWGRLLWTLSLLALLCTFWRTSFTKDTLAFTEQSPSDFRAEPALQVTPSPTPTLSTEAEPSPQETPEPDSQALQATSTFSFTFAAVGYEQVELASPFGAAQYSFRLPRNWLFQDDAILDLDISYIYGQGDSSNIPTLFGDLRVFLNGEILDTFFIEESRFDNRQLRLRLPASELNRTATASVELVFNAGLLCEIPHTASLIVHPTSSLSLTYNEIPFVPDISTYPHPFTQNPFEPNIVHFVLPAEPGAADVTAAASMAAKLGNLRGDMIITPTTDSAFNEARSAADITTEEDHLFVIGQPRDNDLLPLLNSVADLPVSLHEQQLEVVSKGPVTIVPGDAFSHVFTITNTFDQALDLAILNRIPGPQVEFLECASDCRPGEDGSTLTWDNISLEPAEEIRLEVTLEATDFLTTNLILENVLTVIDAESGPLAGQTFAFEVANDTAGELQAVTAEPGDYFFMYNGQAVVESDGIIQEIISPWNEDRAILIVTGLTDEALAKAGQAMSSETRFPGIRGPAAIVQEVLTPEEIRAPSPTLMTGTLEDLGYEDEVLVGQASPEVVYEFYVPHNWALTSESFVDLHFYHSQVIDYESSSLSVFVNNRPAASLFLSEETAEDSHLRIDLAETKVRPGINRITVQANMTLEEECLEDQASQIWFLVENDSAFHLAHREIPDVYYSLSDFPHPFTLTPSLANLLFVIPEEPATVEWGLVLNMAMELGKRVTSQTIIPKTLVGAETLPPELTDFHIIIVGRPSRNALIQEINDELPQPFIPGTDSIEQQIDDIIFRLLPDVDLGYVQFLLSPWNENRAILVVTGTTDESLEATEEIIIHRTNALRGNLALIQEETVNTLDTRELTSEGAAVAVATTVATTAPGEPQIATTITPTITPDAASETSLLAAPASESNRPGWFIPLIGINGLIVLAIVAFVGWRAFKRRTHLQ